MKCLNILASYNAKLDTFGNNREEKKTWWEKIWASDEEELEGKIKCYVRNPRTLWNPLHWCAHNGDIVCVLFLLEKGVKSYIPT